MVKRDFSLMAKTSLLRSLSSYSKTEMWRILTLLCFNMLLTVRVSYMVLSYS